MNMTRLLELIAWWRTFAMGMVKGMLWLSAWVAGAALAVFAVRYPFYDDLPTTYVSGVSWIIGITFALTVIVLLGFWLLRFRPVVYTVNGLVVLLLLAQCFHRDHDTACVESRYVACP